jgi:hypothetical protein
MIPTRPQRSALPLPPFLPLLSLSLSLSLSLFLPGCMSSNSECSNDRSLSVTVSNFDRTLDPEKLAVYLLTGENSDSVYLSRSSFTCYDTTGASVGKGDYHDCDIRFGIVNPGLKDSLPLVLAMAYDGHSRVVLDTFALARGDGRAVDVYVNSPFFRGSLNGFEAHLGEASDTIVVGPDNRFNDRCQ